MVTLQLTILLVLGTLKKETKKGHALMLHEGEKKSPLLVTFVMFFFIPLHKKDIGVRLHAAKLGEPFSSSLSSFLKIIYFKKR